MARRRTSYRVSAVLAVAVAGWLVWTRLICSSQPAELARQAAAVYGEQHPRIVQVTRTATDNSGEPMYRILLAGRFVKYGRPARYLAFSALANRHYIWAICGYATLQSAKADAPPGCVWGDDELPAAVATAVPAR